MQTEKEESGIFIDKKTDFFLLQGMTFSKNEVSYHNKAKNRGSDR